MTTHHRTIVVGVVSEQRPEVLERAAELAEMLHAELVCGYVDASRYEVKENPDGTIVSFPIDPDLVDERQERIDPALEALIGKFLDGKDLTWSSRALAGDPAEALSHLATEVNAAMIIVGTRKPGVKRSLHEFFDGSVGARLAHRQHRPVLIVPVSPVASDSDLPWKVNP
jgi:nucleotide-binding universal stress UspA family protein